MRPYLFGPPDRQLFAIHSPPGQLRSAQRGVVICYPWGHEYANSHRLFRVLGTQLAKLDYHVLRFDYFGTGDSPGKARDISVHRWLEDLQQAIAELEESYGVEAISLVGLRLGATLAVLAGGRHGAIDRMALLEPVVDGPGYVAYLRELHSSYLERFFPGRVPESDDQACGYAFTDEFASELCALDLGALTGPPAAELMCLSSPGLTSGPALAAVLEQLGSEVVLKELVTDEFWRREVGINLAAVPRLVLDDILDFMRSGS